MNNTFINANMEFRLGSQSVPLITEYWMQCTKWDGKGECEGCNDICFYPNDGWDNDHQSYVHSNVVRKIIRMLGDRYE